MNGAGITTRHLPPPPPPSASDPAPPPPDDELPPPPPSDSSIPPPPPSDSSIPPPPPAVSDHAPTSPPVKIHKKPAAAPKKEPLSIEEILRKKREADEVASKPKFLSKKEREKLAIEKREKEYEELQHKAELQRAPPAQSAASTQLTNGTSGTNGTNGVNGRARNRGPLPAGPRSRQDVAPTEPAAMRRPGGPPTNTASRAMPPPETRPTTRATKEDMEATLIRQRYMGADTNTSTFSAQRKRRRTTEKKFQFDWSVDDNTDRESLLGPQIEANFYGRGRLGGFSEDLGGQTRKYARALEERDHEAGSARAQELLDMERRKKAEINRTGLETHWKDKELSRMTQRDWRIMKEDYQISIRAGSGGPVPYPLRSWSESGLPDRLRDIIAKNGYDEPTPVQRAAIPVGMQSRDLIAVAQTGSGKTAAFLLPLFVFISTLPALDESNRNQGPYAIILAPTRELAQQIEQEATKFATPLGFRCVSLVGGHSIEEQAYSLRDGAEMIIATPGRLVDCIERRLLVLDVCNTVILDEADRMIDLGFEEPLNKILDALPSTNEKPNSDEAEDASMMSKHLGENLRYRMTSMYTATMPPAVERTAQKFLRRPVTIQVGTSGEAVETVEQRVEFVSGEDKRKKRLQELLTAQRAAFPPPIIVFVNIKRNVDVITRDISRWGVNAVSLHGGKTQDQREAALASVRRGDVDVLVASDVAARGIDIDSVTLVINFNMAGSIEQYTHRIGRTGRAGKTGVAITFLGNEDTDVMYDLKLMLQKSAISRVPEELRRHEAAQQRQVKGQRNHQQEGGEDGGGHRARR